MGKTFLRLLVVLVSFPHFSHAFQGPRSAVSRMGGASSVMLPALSGTTTPCNPENVTDRSARLGGRDTQDQPQSSATSRRKEKKGKKPQLDRPEWSQMLDEFHEQAFDETFVHHPIRRNVVQAALQYPSDSKCLMPGSHKHLGGAYDPTDGCIYGVPANSKSVMCLYMDPAANRYRMKHIPLPPQVSGTKFKWLRGIFADGYLWAIPSWADSVLCVDVDGYWGRRELQGDVVQLIDLPKQHRLSTWQWHGAGINPGKTAIYCIPSNAAHVLKVDLVKKTTSFISIDFDPEQYPDFALDLTNKWYGGIPGNDGCVYGIPYRASAVLQINTANDSARLVGPNYGVQKYYWHGGINVAGRIYAHPSHAETVLVIDTTSRDANAIEIKELPIQYHDEQSASTKQSYKWLGGAVGTDGNVYCPACDTTAALMIHTKAGTCSTFGYAGDARNKWQGGVLSPRDGCVYCIPASGQHVLRISTSTTPPALQLLGSLPAHKDKWQGGHVGLDGSLYFIPENGFRVLRVTPPLQPPQLVDGRLPENDVVIEFL
jgi:hypothetical protein